MCQGTAPDSESLPETTEGGVMSDLTTLTLLNNSTTYTQCPDGYKPRPGDVPYPRPNSVLEEALAVSLMLIFFTFGALLPTVLVMCVVAVSLFGSIPAAALLGITAADCLLPAGKVWPAFQTAYVFDVLRRHFRHRSIHPVVPYMDPSKPCLAVHFPHAFYPMAYMLTPPIYGLPGTGTPKGGAGVISNMLLLLPFYKHIFAWMGAADPADAATLRSLLQHKSVGMLPEGVAGCTQGACPKREAIYLSKRKGFIRIAIQAGAPIVPLYHLGQSQIISFWGPAYIMGKLRMPLGCMWGRWCLPLPRQHDIITVCSHPIAVKQCKHPTEEEVDRVHALVVEATAQLYERYKHLIPDWESRPLLITQLSH